MVWLSCPLERAPPSSTCTINGVFASERGNRNSMFRVCVVCVATSGKSPSFLLRALNHVPSGKIIAAVGQPSGSNGGGVGVAVGVAVGEGVGVGDCAEATEITMQLRLTRNASLVRRGGIFMKPTSRKRHQMRARTLFAFFAKSKFGLRRLTGCVERAGCPAEGTPGGKLCPEVDDVGWPE